MSHPTPKYWDGVMALVLCAALIGVVLISVTTLRPEKPLKDEGTTTLEEPIEEIEARNHRKEHPEAWTFKKH